MKMKCCFLLLLCYVLSCCQEVCGASEYEVKRGMHPFMAFIYYSDPLVLDISKQRFIRSAVLIRPEWLVTTAIGPSLMDPPNGFPKKTLLARAGAITIDLNFTLNEDEDEQEREIVQIVRPYNHSATQWWTTDISLMKTLLPFNMTPAVGYHTLTFKELDPSNLKTCSILVFAKIYGNSTEDKNLIALFVDLLPPSISNCGSHFSANTMACAADSDDNKHADYDPNFCQGNSGGPLICNNDVVGLQTYIGNDCKQPHLYQVLDPWDNFIACATGDKCQEEQCGAICDIIYKDPPKSEEKSTLPDNNTHDSAQDIMEFLRAKTETTTSEIPTPSIAAMTTLLALTTSGELFTADTITVNFADVTIIKETEPTTPDTTTLIYTKAAVFDTTEKMTELYETRTPDTTTYISTKATVFDTTEKMAEVDETSDNVETKQTSTSLEHNTGLSANKRTTQSALSFKMTEMRSWSKEKETASTHIVEDERKAAVESQLAPSQKTRRSNAANRNLNLLQIMLFGFIICLFYC